MCFAQCWLQGECGGVVVVVVCVCVCVRARAMA